ncbi:MAG: Co2+/Mg2+ efflux protein ApaG [Enterovibrio sp.]
MNKEKVAITTKSEYLAEQSDPDSGHFMFTYTMSIENQTDMQIRLVRRRWLITDANEKVVDTSGEGIVDGGEQPFIDSGEIYNYTSAIVIDTPVGVMQGSFTFVNHKRQEFKVNIAPFCLAIPNILN